MRFLPASFLLALFCSLTTAQPITSPPLECPQCGDWDITRAQPSGSVGERLSIDSERVIIPTCGEFAVTVVNQGMTASVDGYRTYRVTMALQPRLVERLCSTSPEASIRLEMEIGVGHRQDGGVADFQVYKRSQAAPLLVAGAWNFKRDNPCDSGSGRGSAMCQQFYNARTYKTLAVEVYDAQANINPQVSAALAKQFNVATFAADVFRFCRDREANSGGGTWPYAWALTCQAKRLDDKLAELRAWRSCLDQKRSKCPTVTNKFDKSASDEK